ncbi:T9SS sorting signal type C domain-containing protein [Flavobacterium wongokense]|uniref:T9SS sorting signal type C domain-containing protein n=1 Tax=Flavobacterium wongokense TaxID=2910674 RepID=UPI001F19BD36|nr:T9SS sorting signal type C domain-containing protein [Flavobacterium sp. WG47]MCF6133247.1 T9SS sorting signal type C domain-containing protein [Flavobacterium sp. WG47]
MKAFLLSLIAVFLLSIDSQAQCTITGTTVNTSTLTCSSFSGCSIVYVGDGTNPTSLNMNADLNLSCLGSIQLVVRNNASIDFSPGNNRLTLGDGSAIVINTGGNLVGGSCNASERIYIGTNLLASCNGGAGADLSFSELINFGGTGSLASNSPVCTGNTLNLLATPPPNGTYTYSFLGSGLPGAGTTYSSTPSYTLTAPGSAGSYVYQVKMKSSLAGNPIIIAEITVVVNSGLATSTPVTTLTQPNCSVSTGTITITSPTGAGMKYSINGLTYTNTTGIFTGVAIGTYSVTAKNSSGCISPAASVTIAQQTDTWNGSVWSTGSPPTSSEKIVFSGNFSSTANLTGCSCLVSAGNVVINAGHTLSITNDVKVTSGSLTFEDTASLVQTNDASVNSGNITYKRKTTPLKQYDYTYWSSPVAAATLSQLSTNSLMYNFSPTINNWVYQTGGVTMVQGVGYIGRAPSNLTYSPTQIVETSFVGVPGNGVITTPILKSAGTYNLVGNPYPSAIDVDLFITANTASTNGTVYFWTHNTAITNLQYTTNDYAKYNLTGAVRTSTSAMSGGALPTGKIAAGQGFFIEAKTSLANGTYSATFNNSMRISGNNTQFFKTSQPTIASNTISEGLERHRIWLSLNGNESSGAYNQMLIGYIQNATNDFDSLFDGKTLPVGNPVSLYTMVGDLDLSIQGKSLPFNTSDIIPLGYNTLIDGELTINLDDFDGVFNDQDIYVLDRADNTFHNLKESPYTFVTVVGAFENRLELRFDNQALGTSNPVNDTNVKIIGGDHQLQVISSAVAIKNVEVYDILGKLLFSQNGLNTNFFKTALNVSPQVLLVKVTLEDQQTITRKTISH